MQAMATIESVLSSRSRAHDFLRSATASTRRHGLGCPATRNSLAGVQLRRALRSAGRWNRRRIHPETRSCQEALLDRGIKMARMSARFSWRRTPRRWPSCGCYWWNRRFAGWELENVWLRNASALPGMQATRRSCGGRRANLSPRAASTRMPASRWRLKKNTRVGAATIWLPKPGN